MSSRFFFKQVQHPISAFLASSLIYGAPAAGQSAEFNKVNGFTRDEMLYPGRTIIVPSLEGISEATTASVANMCMQLSHAHRNAKTMPAPKSFNESFHAALLNVSEFDVAGSLVGSAKETLGLRNDIVGRRLDPVLKQLKSIGDKTLQIHLGRMERQTGGLSMGGRNQLEAIKQMLTKDVETLPKWLKAAKATPISALDASQISISDAARSFTTDGSPISTKRTADLLESVSERMGKVVNQGERLAIPLGDANRLASHLETAGIGLTAASAGWDAYKMFETASAAEKKFGPMASEIVTVHQSAKIGGNVAGGFIGSTLMGAAVAPAVGPLLVMGPLGWGALGILGVVVVGVGYVSGKLGESAGGAAAEAALKSAAPDQGDFVDTVIDFSNNPVPLD